MAGLLCQRAPTAIAWGMTVSLWLFIAGCSSVQAFVPTTVGNFLVLRSPHRCSHPFGQLRMAEGGKGFGKADDTPAKQSTKKQPEAGEGVKSVEEQEELMRKVMSGKSTGNMQAFSGSVEVEDGKAKQAAKRGQRAEPVNLDAGAMFDAGWLKQSVDTVLSDEWVQGAAEPKESECTACGGTGRIQGGLGVLPGLKWWPIKAFRPCPECEKAGRAYNRRGQGLDEVLFGKDDMPLDYKKPTSGGGLTPDDVKKIMEKKSKNTKKK